MLTFDWQDFYQNWEGGLYFDWLRQQFNEIADVVLIDSRTGVTEMGGVCTYHLADTVVMFCIPSQQSIHGTYKMAQNFTSSEVQKLRGGRPLNVLIIPARIERAEGDLLDVFQKEFIEWFEHLTPKEEGIIIKQLWESGIPYVPKYSFKETVAVRESGTASAEDMVESFYRLITEMGRLLPEALFQKFEQTEALFQKFEQPQSMRLKSLKTSPEMLLKCHNVLIECNQFDSDRSLQAVFITNELTIFRDFLPQTDSKAQRVSETILFLLDKKLRDGRLVFPIFLEMLCKLHSPDDFRFRKLKELCSDIKKELSEVDIVDIPFVIVAMTRNEATALFEETVFERPDVAPSERLTFRAFKETLQESENAVWISRYFEDRNQWNPHVGIEQTIRTMILEASDWLNTNVQAQSNSFLIRPLFLSQDFLGEDDKERVNTWEQLSQLVCVIIVDAISLFHPLIYRKLLQSEMSSNHQTAMGILILPPKANSTNVFIEQEIQKRLQRASARFDQFNDNLCNFEVNRQRNFRIWLINILPELAEKIQTIPDYDARTWMGKKIEQIYGISEIIRSSGAF